MAAPPVVRSLAMRRALRFLASFTDYEQKLPKGPLRAAFDLDRLRTFLGELGHPARGVPAIHITGTKGKTSTTYFADALLAAHGLRTFRFISPHVERINERLACSGVEVTDEAFAAAVDRLRAPIRRIQRARREATPTFFECLTVLGFLIAEDSRADALVMEVGLGGRLDATNVLENSIAVVTSIGLDHVHILGHTHDAIAGEKAGIFKPGHDVILGLVPGDRGFGPLEARALALGCPIIRPGLGISVLNARPGVSDRGAPELRASVNVLGQSFLDLRLQAGPPHQALNAALALAACSRLLKSRGRSIDASTAAAALARVHIPGRAERLNAKTPIILDGAHTAESVGEAVHTAARLSASGEIHALVGVTREREVESVFRELGRASARVTATTIPNPRAMSAAQLATRLRRLQIEVVAEPDLEVALESAEAAAAAAGLPLLVTGSLYLVGEVRRHRSPSASRTLRRDRRRGTR
jgi:dihydrofolate synthase/folylpolyglutamate synthase